MVIKTTKEIFDNFVIRCQKESKYINDDSVSFSQELWVSLDELKRELNRLLERNYQVEGCAYGQAIGDVEKLFFPSPEKRGGD